MFRIPHTVHLAAALCTVAAAQAPAPKPIPFAGLAYLELTADQGAFHAFVHGATPKFFGVVLLSTSPNQTHYLTGLPPFLSDFVVLCAGFATGQDLELKAPIPATKEAWKLYGQAVLFDAEGLWASGIVPVTVPAGVRPAMDADQRFRK